MALLTPAPGQILGCGGGYPEIVSGCYLIDLEDDDPRWEPAGSLAENRGLARAAPVEGGARWIITGGQDEVRVFFLNFFWRFTLVWPNCC